MGNKPERDGHAPPPLPQYGDWIQMSDHAADLTAIDNNVLQATKLLGSQSGPHPGHHHPGGAGGGHQRDLCP